MKRSTCVFGEVLFDEFPDGRRVLGGAPFNVAWHLAAFGESPFLISRVGEDADAAEVRGAMQAWGMDLSGLQTDSEKPTGRVRVHFEHGEPRYDIVYPSAWDAIVAPSDMPSCRLLYHGSLACRDAVPRATLDSLRQSGPRSLFVDVNMRPPWWNREGMLGGLRGADWVKLNQDELHELAGPGDTEASARKLIEHCGLRHMLVTLGAAGAWLFRHDGEAIRARPGASVEVVDTVGAGDALASVMLLGIARGWPPQQALERAQEFASAVVGLRGATTRDRSFYRPFIENWL